MGNNAVIIENKLNNAVDRPDQLKDYLEDTENKGKNVLKVVYVPLFAWKRVQEYISAEVEYLYPQKLSAWLNACVARSPMHARSRRLISGYSITWINQTKTI